MPSEVPCTTYREERQYVWAHSTCQTGRQIFYYWTEIYVRLWDNCMDIPAASSSRDLPLLRPTQSNDTNSSDCRKKNVTVCIYENSKQPNQVIISYPLMDILYISPPMWTSMRSYRQRGKDTKPGHGIYKLKWSWSVAEDYTFYSLNWRTHYWYCELYKNNGLLPDPALERSHSDILPMM